MLLGDCRAVLKTLPSESVHCVVTSPPYWGLRSYLENGHADKGLEIGLEPTVGEWVQTMVEVFGEVRRILRKDGTLWLNLGDSYACAPNGRKAKDIVNDDRTFRDKPFSTISSSLKPKDLVGQPWRVAFALQSDGWYLRSDIIWAKPNPMPESVADRPTRAHEYVFLMAKEERYFYDADAIREPHTEPWRSTGRLEQRGAKDMEAGVNGGFGLNGIRPREYNPAGRNKRTVWEIATQPTPEAHFATFPEALVEPCILAGTSERGCCPECGAPWRRVVEKEDRIKDGRREQRDYPGSSGQRSGKVPGSNTRGYPVYEDKTTGWQPTCTHPHTDADTVPCVVLDPFGGSGTVGRVATRLGRRSILIELNPEYIAIAEKRTAQRGLGL